MHAGAQRTRSRLGFTLLELMMAVFILAVAATVLLGTQSTSMRLMEFSNNQAIITMLTRAKMQDIEYEVLAEGFTDGYADTMSGDFDDEGYSEIEWEATIEAIEISDDASNDFVVAINEQLYGAGEESGSLGGNLAFSQFLPLMISYMPTIINQLGQRIRRVTLTVNWEYLGRNQSLTVSQYIVTLTPPEGTEPGIGGAGPGGTGAVPPTGGIPPAGGGTAPSPNPIPPAGGDTR